MDFRSCISFFLTSTMHPHLKKVTAAGMLITLGIIFGDIGTSPLYTFQTLLQEGGTSSQDGAPIEFDHHVGFLNLPTFLPLCRLPPCLRPPRAPRGRGGE